MLQEIAQWIDMSAWGMPSHDPSQSLAKSFLLDLVTSRIQTELRAHADRRNLERGDKRNLYTDSRVGFKPT